MLCNCQGPCLVGSNMANKQKPLCSIELLRVLTPFWGRGHQPKHRQEGLFHSSLDLGWPVLPGPRRLRSPVAHTAMFGRERPRPPGMRVWRVPGARQIGVREKQAGHSRARISKPMKKDGKGTGEEAWLHGIFAFSSFPVSHSVDQELLLLLVLLL